MKLSKENKKKIFSVLLDIVAGSAEQATIKAKELREFYLSLRFPK
jgi:hypothetical protein